MTDQEWLRKTCDELRELFASMPDIEVRSNPLAWDPDCRLLNCEFAIRAVDGDKPTAKDRCQEAVCRALEIVASGRLAFIRSAPEVNVDTDFATLQTNVRGYVRFAASPDEGGWKYVVRSDGCVYYTGFLAENTPLTPHQKPALP